MWFPRQGFHTHTHIYRQGFLTFLIGFQILDRILISSRGLSTVFLLLVLLLLLWRKFINSKSARGMLINPRIVFTFTRQRWSSTSFSSYLGLAGVKIKYTQYTSSIPSFYSHNNVLPIEAIVQLTGVYEQRPCVQTWQIHG